MLVYLSLFVLMYRGFLGVEAHSDEEERVLQEKVIFRFDFQRTEGTCFVRLN